MKIMYGLSSVWENRYESNRHDRRYYSIKTEMKIYLYGSKRLSPRSKYGYESN